MCWLVFQIRFVLSDEPVPFLSPGRAWWWHPPVSPWGQGTPHAKQLWGGDGDQSTALQAGGVGKLEASNDKMNQEESYCCVFPL